MMKLPNILVFSKVDTEGVPVSYWPEVFNYDVEMLWDALPLVRYDNTPRVECWMNDYGLPYTYGAGRGVRTYQPAEWNWLVEYVQKSLNKTHGTSFDCCFINGYETSKDQLGWHADDSPEMDNMHPIVSVSFGVERAIWFRKPGEKGVATKGLTMGHGSVTLMHAKMQQNWEHRIPKHHADCGKRVSMTFRKLIF
jgi:alkylated DNA repair dioxygenase AlkB